MNDEQLEEILSALYIQSLRIYDVLMFIANKQGVDTDQLEKMHAEGIVYCPDPALVIEDDDQNDENVK